MKKLRLVLLTLLCSNPLLAVDSGNADVLYVAYDRDLFSLNLENQDLQRFEHPDNAVFIDISIDVAGRRLFLTDYHRDRVFMMSMGDPTFQLLFEIPTLVWHLAFDPKENQVYVAAGDGIWKCDLATLEIEWYIPDGDYGDAPIYGQAMGIALDVSRDKIYTTTLDSSGVWAVEKDASSSEQLIFEEDEDIFLESIVVDEKAKKLYWINVSTAQLNRSNLDGSNVEAILDSNTLLQPRGLVLDRFGGKLYWTEGYEHTVKRCDLKGNNVETILTLPPNLDPSLLYWALSLDLYPGRALYFRSTLPAWRSGEAVTCVNANATVLDFVTFINNDLSCE